MAPEHKNMLLYVAKCVSGCIFLLSVGKIFPSIDISWIVISMLLVLSPDEKEVIPLTIIRVKANLIASGASIIFLLLAPTVAIAICLAITVTIIACYIFNLMAGSRAATAAVVIISLHPPGIHLWSTAYERVVSVILGCAFALLLSFVFHRDIPFKYGRQAINADKMNE